MSQGELVTLIALGWVLGAALLICLRSAVRAWRS